MHIGMLLYPRLTQLDLTGPFELFHRVPGAHVHLVWKTLDPVYAEGGLGLLPSITLDDCPPLDLVCVPGGFGQSALMNDEAVLSFLRRQAASARWITSVCSGALLLGAAGLLQGYRATTYWALHESLAAFGAIPTDERVVIDRDRITAGGVTAGIDFGLRVIAEVCGEEMARALTLELEYDPAPPFACGHPRSADPALVARVRARAAQRLAERQAQAERR